eukprot:5943578-Pleurochrysis_carterae.AAC.1
MRSGSGRGRELKATKAHLRGGPESLAQSRQHRPCAHGDAELGERSAKRSASTHAARVHNENRTCKPKGAARCDGFRYCTSRHVTKGHYWYDSDIDDNIEYRYPSKGVKYCNA